MIQQNIYKYFQEGDLNAIIHHLEVALTQRNESPFWADKVVPFTEAILSVLIPLEKQGLLFDPQGKKEEYLTPELFFQWNDFVSLKMLAFIIQQSNQAKRLVRTQIDSALCEQYKTIDLEKLAAYLAKNNVNLENEHLDFPIATYNLHQGVSNVIKSLLEA